MSIESLTRIRAYQLPLPHEVLLLDTLLAEDALTVLGSGMCEISLGLLFLATWMIKRQKRSVPLILILGLSTEESFQACIDRARQMSVFNDLRFKFLGPDMDPKERMLTLSRGGVFGSTSRTFVIDALAGRLPHANIDGIIMFEAHKMISKPNDIFMVQLLREQRVSRGFCKAFTSEPVEMTKIFNHAERTMRALNVQKLLLAPRMAPRTAEVLNDENVKPMLEQRLLKLSPEATEVQKMLLELISKGVRDLERGNPGIVEVNKSNYYRNLERELGDQIDPIWHKLSFHDRRIYQDIQVFRAALRSLVTLDCVQFWLLLRNLKSSGFSSHDGIDASWFLTSESAVLFACARQRLYNVVRSTVTLKLEPHSKLLEINKIILRVLKEADDETAQAQEADAQVNHEASQPSQLSFNERPIVRILIVTDSEHFRRQVEESIYLGPEYSLIKSLRQAHRTVAMEKRGDLEHSGSFSELEQLEEACRQAKTPRVDDDEDLDSMLEQLLISANVIHRPIVHTLAMNSQPLDALERSMMTIIPHAVILTSLEPAWLRQCEIGNARILFSLMDLQKRVSPDEKVVSPTKIEPEQKRRRLSKTPPVNLLMTLDNAGLGLPETFEVSENDYIPTGPDLKVFVLGFAESLENEEFTAQLSTEQQAWDHLIHARKSLLVYDKQSDLDALSILTTPEERFRFMLSAGREQSLGSSRKAGGGLAMVMQELRKRATQFHHEQVKQAIELGLPVPPARNLNLERLGPAELLEMVKPSILVDVREFRSSLPFQLWNAGIHILPLTLPVADYVLAQDVGIERKSLSDLIQSLASGRLFRQCERLIRAFKVPTLLIEFDSSSRGYLRSLAKMPNISPSEQTAKDKLAFQHSRFHIGNSRSSEGMEPSILVSKLAVLIMHFPTLKFVWSADCAFSTDAFFVLKEGRGQPDSSAVMRATCLEMGKKKPELGADLDEIEPIDNNVQTSMAAKLSAQNAQNIVAVDLLQKIPGITGRGLDRIVRRTKSLKELLMMSSEDLIEAIGKEEASRLETCLNTNLC